MDVFNSLANGSSSATSVSATADAAGSEHAAGNSSTGSSRAGSPNRGRRNGLAHVLLRESPTPIRAASNNATADQASDSAIDSGEAASAAWRKKLLTPAKASKVKVGLKACKTHTELERRLNKQVLKHVKNEKPQTEFEMAIMHRRESKPVEDSGFTNNATPPTTAEPATAAGGKPMWMQEFINRRAAIASVAPVQSAAVATPLADTTANGNNSGENSKMFAEIRARRWQVSLLVERKQTELKLPVASTTSASTAPPPPPPPVPPPMSSSLMPSLTSVPRSTFAPPPPPPQLASPALSFSKAHARTAHSTAATSNSSSGGSKSSPTNMFAELLAKKQNGLRPAATRSNLPLPSKLEEEQGVGMGGLFAAIQQGVRLNAVDRPARNSAASKPDPGDSMGNMFAEIIARKGKLSGVSVARPALLPKVDVKLSPKDELMEAIRARAASQVAQRPPIKALSTRAPAPQEQKPNPSASSLNPLCTEIQASQLTENKSKFKLKPVAQPVPVARAPFAAAVAVAARTATRTATLVANLPQPKGSSKPWGSSAAAVDQAKVLANSKRPTAPTVGNSGKPIPSWKQKILQRKLDAEFAKELAVEEAEAAKEARWDGIPAWKRAIIEQKEAAQAQKYDTAAADDATALAPQYQSDASSAGEPLFAATRLKVTTTAAMVAQPAPAYVAPVADAPKQPNPLSEWQKKKEREKEAKDATNAAHAAAEKEKRMEEAKWKGVPAWKRGIIEKKKRSNQIEIDALRQKQAASEARWTGVPAWKRAIIEKKEAGVPLDAVDALSK